MLLHQWLSVSNTIIAFVLFLACALALGSDPILFALALVLLAPCILANSALRLRGGRRAASLSVVSGGLLGMGSLFALYTAVLFFWETFIFSPPLWGTGLSLIIVVTCLAFAALLGSAAVRAFAAARLFGRLPARTGALPIPRSSIAAGEDAD
jgi:hypothetical protein